MEDAPYPAAATGVAGFSAGFGAGRPVAAARARHAARVLEEWRSDPDWANRCIGGVAAFSGSSIVAHLIAAWRDDSVALRDAAGIVARDDDANDVAACLAALGGDGRRALDDDLRAALWTRALQDSPSALGGGLDDAVRRAAGGGGAARLRKKRNAAALIGHIGAAAWATTDAALRERLIDAAAQSPINISRCAPSWTGMSDAERARLVTAVVDDGAPRGAYSLLTARGGGGRRALSAAQRVVLDALAAQNDAWRTSLLRVADVAWNAPSDAERRTLMARPATDPPGSAAFIRTVGIAGWRALPSDVQKRLCTSVLRNAQTLPAFPMALWHDLANGLPPPPTSRARWDVIREWRAEDAAADLSNLPHEHQAPVLAHAPRRAADCVPSSSRMRRLLVAWNGMTAGGARRPGDVAAVDVGGRRRRRPPACVEADARRRRRCAGDHGAAEWT